MTGSVSSLAAEPVFGLASSPGPCGHRPSKPPSASPRKIPEPQSIFQSGRGTGWVGEGGEGSYAHQTLHL